MKRLVAIPAMMVCACTITVTPLQKKPSHHRHRIIVHHTVKIYQPPPRIIPVPTPVSELHEQYKPIYEKLPPQSKDTYWPPLP